LKTPIENFAERLVLVFGKPKIEGSFADFVAEIGRALGGYSAQDLDDAASYLIDHSKYRSWPLIGEMREATKIARNRRATAYQSRQQPTSTKAKEDPARLEAKRWAGQWIATNPLGRRALIEKWGRQLFQILVQKHMIASRLGKQEPEAINMPDDDVKYCSRFSRRPHEAMELCDLSVIFGSRDDGLRWQKQLEGMRVEVGGDL
jgi:hypothetical protein